MFNHVVILAPSLKIAEDFYRASLKGLFERQPRFVRFDDLRFLYGLRDTTVFIIGPAYRLEEDEEMRAALFNSRKIFVSDWR